jgi:hypothetical protein
MRPLLMLTDEVFDCVEAMGLLTMADLTGSDLVVHQGSIPGSPPSSGGSPTAQSPPPRASGRKRASVSRLLEFEEEATRTTPGGGSGERHIRARVAEGGVVSQPVSSDSSMIDFLKAEQVDSKTTAIEAFRHTVCISMYIFYYVLQLLLGVVERSL